MQIKNEKKHREAFFFYKRLVVYSSRSLVLTNLCSLNVEHFMNCANNWAQNHSKPSFFVHLEQKKTLSYRIIYVVYNTEA